MSMPPWCADYFELKVIKTLLAQEKLSLLTCLEEFKLVAWPVKRVKIRNNFLSI